MNKNTLRKNGVSRDFSPDELPKWLNVACYLVPRNHRAPIVENLSLDNIELKEKEVPFLFMVMILLYQLVIFGYLPTFIKAIKGERK